MSDKDVLRPALWTARPVAETVALYTDWAATYDAEVSARGYRTPDRIAAALQDLVAPETPMLDYGCGTGLSGLALRRAGFIAVDGTDITAAMLEKAQARGIYRRTWLSTAEDPGFERGAYPVIVAAGVISLGAAPPDTLATLLDRLQAGGLLAFSYNDPTRADKNYEDALTRACDSGAAALLLREHGPHLDDVGMNSDVILLRRK